MDLHYGSYRVVDRADCVRWIVKQSRFHYRAKGTEVQSDYDQAAFLVATAFDCRLANAPPTEIDQTGHNHRKDSPGA